MWCISANPSKAALKMKKKREAKKAARQQAVENGEIPSNGVPAPFKPSILSEEITTDDPEKLKKIKKLKSVRLYNRNTKIIINIIFIFTFCKWNKNSCNRVTGQFYCVSLFCFTRRNIRLLLHKIVSYSKVDKCPTAPAVSMFHTTVGYFRVGIPSDSRVIETIIKYYSKRVYPIIKI